MKPKYTLKQERSLVKRAMRNYAIDELRHERTRQRRFENGFVHYQAFAQLDDDDAEHCRVVHAPYDRLEAVGRRDFTLRSPAAQAQFNLDFEYFEEQLRRTDKTQFQVFRAVFRGLSPKEIGIKKDTWRRNLQRLENFLRQEATNYDI